MTEPATDSDTAQEAAPETPSWVRVLIFGGAALALLLVGATAGLLIGRWQTDPDTAQPNDVDIGFAQDMSIHHLQAVQMANIARDNSKNPDVTRLAFDISMTQQGQVGRMSGWLALWDAPSQATGEVMTWMPEGHQHGKSTSDRGGTMPGMASTTELSKLKKLDGKKLDVYFLQLMLRHHQGGVGMAEYAEEQAAVPVVRSLAASILESQGSESELMKQMLAERDAEPLSPG